MCEITRHQFEEAFHYICDDIQRALFICLDTEFTGLSLSDKDKPSLFDDGAARYQKLKQNVSRFIPSQIGISAFVKEGEANIYTAHSYNFYLFPQSFGPINVRFCSEAASLEFLARHNFDFNKFVYEGISYLNNEQEKLLRQHLNGSSIGIHRINEDQDELQECCSLVAEWLVSAREGNKIEVPGPSCVSNYVVLTELRLRFPQTWASVREDGQIVVEMVSEETQKKLIENAKNEEEERVINEKLGFTRLFRQIVELKKPIVGHNCLQDLLMLYHYFHEPLPDRYSTFKENICSMFPHIYDTKHISNSIRKPMGSTGLFENTGLEGLVKSLDSEKGRFHFLYSPQIHLAEGFEHYQDAHNPHEAGYDSFMCGKVFLRMAHIIALSDKNVQQRALGFYEYLTALKPYKQNVNVIRGSIDYTKLDGADPASRRPQYLHVQPRKRSGSINAPMVAQLFSAYGSVDVQMKGSKAALVAIGNHRAAEDILKNFRKHDKIFVSKYSLWKHSPLVRGILWTGVIVSGGFCALTLLGFPRSRSNW